MEIFEFDVKKCLEAKQKLNSYDITSNTYQKHCAPRKYLGSCVELFGILQPDSIIDFYEKEKKYAKLNHRFSIYKRGLTYKDWYNLAVKYKQLVEEQTNEINFDLSVYFYGLLCHSIVETFKGQKSEQEALNFLKLRGYKAKKINGDRDAIDGIDIAAKGINEDFYLQVKPITFFIGKKSHTIQDNIKACHNRERLLKEDKIDTYFMLYELDYEKSEIKWFKKDNGDFLFHIDDLLEYDKDDIENTFKRKSFHLTKSFLIS